MADVTGPIVRNATGPIVRTLVLSGGSSPPTSTLLDGLVSWWSMEEIAKTTPREDSHGTNTLSTITGTSNPLGVAGLVNNACQFVGAEANRLYCASSGVVTGANDYTYAMWINNDQYGAWEGLLQINTGNSVLVGGTDFFTAINGTKLVWYLNNSGVWKVQTSTATVNTTGAWFLIVISHKVSTKTMTMSVNDDSNGDSTTYAGTHGTPGDNFQIGNYGHLATYAFDGKIDEVAHWNRVLTAAEITELYNSGAGIGYPG